MRVVGDYTVYTQKGEELKPTVRKDEPKPKPWVEVIQGNRSLNRGMAVDFIAPTFVNGKAEITIDESDVYEELEFQENSIILFALGQSLSMNAVKKFMEKTQNFISLPELFYNDEGYFIMKCKNREDMELVMEQGPYFIYGKPVFLRKWTTEFEMKEDLLRVLPIWITLPQLPLHLWGERSISKITSVIGKPITTDECTAKKLRISYARVLVEVDITQNPIETVDIKDHKGKLMEQKIEYEWRPSYCQSCLKIGHDCAIKKVPGKKLVQVWKPTKQTEETLNRNKPTETKAAKKIEEKQEEPQKDQEEPNQELNPAEWTVITSRRMEKGKREMIHTPKSSFVPYQNTNTFTPLRIGDCPKGNTPFD